MKPLSLTTVANYSKGAIDSGAQDSVVKSVSNDTRTIEAGALYVALRGENFDGHDFVEAAASAGASAVMVDTNFNGAVPDGCAAVRVADTLAGLQALAHHYRRELGLTVVGVTGSNGKTSTKDFIGAALGSELAVTATLGNLNNHIGLPRTILSADERHKVGIWEMGMSNPGEIEVLAAIAEPDIAVITNVGVAHIEFMKTREAIALEKGMLAEAINEGGLVVLNADDDYSASIAERTRARVITAGIDAGDIRASEVESGMQGVSFTASVGGKSARVDLPVPGRHMVTNGLLAIAVACHLGLELEVAAAGLSAAELSSGRLQRRELMGVDFIDDSYNANPDSVKAALRTLAEINCEGRRFAVLGGMAELGDGSEQAHRDIGKVAAGEGIDVILSVGDVAKTVVEGVNGGSNGHVEHFENHSDCAAFLAQEAKPGDLVLIKGSRSSAMERVMEALVNS